METIDINKVAGLQALDSEGNVLGVVSMEQLTDMVAGKLATELAAQNTAPAMRTMSLTASPAAASVAATGVDKTEGQLGDVTDPGYVRVLDKNGNSGKQGISQFASVVGGLIGAKNFIKTSNNLLTSRDDMNSLESGIIYSFAPESGFPSNFPSSAQFGRGIIDTRICYPHLLQIIYAFNSSSLKIVARMSYDEGTHWYDWMEL